MNQIFHRDVAPGQLIASLAKRLFNGYTYPEQFTRPVRPAAPPATQPPPNPMDLLPVPEAPADPDPAQVDQEDGNPDRPAAPTSYSTSCKSNGFSPHPTCTC